MFGSGFYSDQSAIDCMSAHIRTGKPRHRYHSYPLKGSKRQTAQAWLGLYPLSRNSDGELRFFKINEAYNDLDEARACRAVQSFLRAGSRHFDKAPSSIAFPGNVNDASAWLEAQEQAKGDGLPICYAAFAGRNSAVFYYTRLVPTQMSWTRFRGAAARQVLRHR